MSLQVLLAWQFVAHLDMGYSGGEPHLTERQRPLLLLYPGPAEVHFTWLLCASGQTLEWRKRSVTQS